MLQNFKPEIKLFVIVAFVAVVISVAGILLLKTLQSASIERQAFVSQEECEEKTGKGCFLFQGLCQVMVAQNVGEEEENEKFLRDCGKKIGTWQPIDEKTGDETSTNPPNTKLRGEKIRDITGWTNSVIEEFSTFDSLQYFVDKGNNRIFMHNPGGFEGDRFAGDLWIVDSKAKTIRKIYAGGFVLLPGGDKLLISKTFGLETRESPSQEYKISDKLVKDVAGGVGVTEQEVRDHIDYIGGKPSAVISALFVVDLKTGKETSLGLFGGIGGLFILKNGDIYVSSNLQMVWYSGDSPEQGHVVFGTAPYYKFNPVTKLLSRMPDEFEPDFSEIDHPFTAYPQGKDAVIAELGGAKIVRLDDEFPWFYLVTEDKFSEISGAPSK